MDEPQRNRVMDVMSLESKEDEGCYCLDGEPRRGVFCLSSLTSDESLACQLPGKYPFLYQEAFTMTTKLRDWGSWKPDDGSTGL